MPLFVSGTLYRVVDQIDPESASIYSFEVEKHQHFSYRSNMFKLMQKTLQICSKVSLRTNEDGFLCLQFMVRVETCLKICFVELFFAPVEHTNI